MRVRITSLVPRPVALERLKVIYKIKRVVRGDQKIIAYRKLVVSEGIQIYLGVDETDPQ